MVNGLCLHRAFLVLTTTHALYSTRRRSSTHTHIRTLVAQIQIRYILNHLTKLLYV